ncbi:MAG: sugar nucleotide-binding protein, partial [Patescibacteria group bacterium]
MNSKIAILGSSGMLGHQVANYFYRHYYPADLTFFARNIDSKKWQGVETVELDDDWCALHDINKYDYIINCIGVINRRIDEKDPSSRINAFIGNVSLPYYLARKVEGTNTQILQISTDCVFNGKEPLALTEVTPHNATDWYGKTKSLGEVVSKNFHHIRTSIIGREEPPNRRSLLEWFLHLEQGAEVNGFVNHLWNGTTTLEFAKLCFSIITNNIDMPLVHHFVHIDIVTKYGMLKTFAKVFDRPDIKINPYETEPVYKALTTLSPNLNAELVASIGYKK